MDTKVNDYTMATIKDIALASGVSIATVSRVVNNGPKVGEKTRKRVIAMMNELGYTPNANARALVTQKSSTIGVVIPDLTDPFFASLANGVEQVASENNMQMLLSTGKQTADSELKAIQLLEQQRCDCIIAHSKLLDEKTLVELCRRIPGLVLIDRYISLVKERCIWLDNLEGGKIAARHLLSLNHKSLACIISNFAIEDPQLRLSGFKQIALDSDIIIDEGLIAAQEPTLKGGELAAQQLLAQNKPFSAVFSYNDAMAIGAISVFEDNGFRVPADISVLGFDDVLLSQYSRPKLTTLNYPIQEMAKNAANLALSILDNKIPVPKNRKYIPSLIKRESVNILSSTTLAHGL